MSIRQDGQSMLERLIRIAQDLYAETGGYLDDPSDQQLWYNRGYANGILSALEELGYGTAVDDAIEARDGAQALAGQEALPWGRAYRHGFEMGLRETREVIS
jgi:hypothetical protein